MKFINMKRRFASAALAGALALSMAVPAFAAGNSTNITGSYRAITLAVTVPSTGTAIINPYGLPYELAEGASISGQQITTGAPLLVQNKSAVALKVGASLVGVPKGTFTFSDNAITDTETGNKGNVLFQMFEAPGVTEANAADTTALNPMFAALKDEDALCNTVLKATSDSVPAVTEDDIIILKEGSADGELQDGGAAFFRLSGTVAKKPTTAWVAADGFTAKVTFTFEPDVYATEAGTLAANVTALDSVVDTEANLTLTLPAGVTSIKSATWTSSDPTKISVAAVDSDTTLKTAKATYVASGAATITVTYVGNDNVTYKASVDLTAA